jgi:hypothetical protein
MKYSPAVNAVAGKFGNAIEGFGSDGVLGRFACGNPVLGTGHAEGNERNQNRENRD